MTTTMTTPLLLVLFFLACTYLSHADSSSKRLRVRNEAGLDLSLFWINPQTRQESLISMPTIPDGTTFPLETFLGHEFEMRESECSSEENCRAFTFVIEKDKEQLVVNSDMEPVFDDDLYALDSLDATNSMIEKCQSSAKGDLSDLSLAMERFVSCVEGGVAKSLEKANEEIAYHTQVRRNMANLLENYTCMDTDLPTSPDLDEYEWKHSDNVDRMVHVKHNRAASKIHVVENFISPEECQAMESTAQPDLHIATVADGKGGSQFSENRKAMQAGITVNWELEEDGDHIAQLSRRVYDYTNHVLGLDIQEFGQEDLMSIQYFGRGLNDTSPDRYTPHCDGDCTGLPHKTGTRMATMVMYCTLPELGGATNFRNSGIHVVPQEGNAVFFSYINPESKVMDTGFTEHSGCPVLVGEKKIVTQWIRLGVDEENPWTSFNTLGIKRSEANDQ